MRVAQRRVRSGPRGAAHACSSTIRAPCTGRRLRAPYPRHARATAWDAGLSRWPSIRLRTVAARNASRRGGRSVRAANPSEGRHRHDAVAERTGPPEHALRSRCGSSEATVISSTFPEPPLFQTSWCRMTRSLPRDWPRAVSRPRAGWPRGAAPASSVRTGSSRACPLYVVDEFVRAHRTLLRCRGFRRQVGALFHGLTAS